MNKNPYKNSQIIQSLQNRLEEKKPLRIACLDLDSTMTGKTAIVNQARKKLEKLGFATVFITSRTEEIVMTQNAYKKSIATKTFFRPEPHLQKKGKKHTYIVPEKFIPEGLLNPMIIAGSTGTRILVLQKDGSYFVDVSYEKQFGDSSKVWREKTFQLLYEINQLKEIGKLQPIDKEENYLTGKTDVFPPDFRLQINFSSLRKKSQFIDKFGKVTKSKKVNVRLTDDSKPEEKRYTVYLTPFFGSKLHAIEHIVTFICRSLKLQRQQLEVLFAGDSFPDLEMGLRGAMGTKATLLLVGKSRLAHAFLNDDIHEFAGEKMTNVKKRLNGKKKNGHYIYTYEENISRNFIIGDEAFANTQAVETIHTYLDSLYFSEIDDSQQKQ